MPDLLLTPRQPGSRRARATAAATAMIMALLLVSCGGSTSTTSTNTAEVSSDAPASAAPTSAAPTSAPASTTDAPTVAATSVPEPPTAAPEATPTTEIPDFKPPTGIVPVRIEIKAIGVDAPTIDLSLAGAEPEVPTNFDDTGWYTQTRLPGEIGPAVIAGHIDSRSGPAVFAQLDKLVAGDEITVYDEAGVSRTFVVVEGNLYPKGDLPPGVFGFGQPEPELRLITCGGTFDEASGHYRDNYVVFARLIA